MKRKADNYSWTCQSDDNLTVSFNICDANFFNFVIRKAQTILPKSNISIDFRYIKNTLEINPGIYNKVKIHSRDCLNIFSFLTSALCIYELHIEIPIIHEKYYEQLEYLLLFIDKLIAERRIVKARLEFQNYKTFVEFVSTYYDSRYTVLTAHYLLVQLEN